MISAEATAALVARQALVARRLRRHRQASARVHSQVRKQAKPRVVSAPVVSAPVVSALARDLRRRRHRRRRKADSAPTNFITSRHAKERKEQQCTRFS